MKKYFAIIALASLTLVACEKVQEFFDDSNDVTTIYAIAGADRTKTAVSEGVVSWSENDKIAVADDAGTMVEFTLTGNIGQEAKFEGNLNGQSLGTYAVYPYTTNSELVNSTTVKVDYLDSWEYGKSIVPMWGEKGNSQYNFHIIGSAVMVTYSKVPTTTNNKKFVFTSNKNITGTVTVSNLDSTPSVSTPDGDKTVTITGISGSATSVSVIVPVPAGNEYNITAQLFDETSGDPIPGTLKAANGKIFNLNRISKFEDVDLTPVITASPSSFDVPSTESSQTITYTIANVAAGEEVTAAANVGWISNFAITGTTVTFDVSQQPAGGAARTGVITLSYNGDISKTITVNQAPAPVINVTTNPVYSVMDGGAGSISYSISNPTGATLTAADNGWLTGSSVSNAVSGDISFTAAAQATDAAPRTSTITLSYNGAEDVIVTVLQEGLIYTLNSSNYTDWTRSNILNDSDPLHFGMQSNDATDCSISSTSDIADGKNISRVAVSSGATGHEGNLTVTVNSLTITAHNTSASGLVIGTKSVTSGITDNTVTLDNPDATSGTPWTGKYFKIVYNIKNNKGNKKGWVEFNNAKFYGYDVL